MNEKSVEDGNGDSGGERGRETERLLKRNLSLARRRRQGENGIADKGLSVLATSLAIWGSCCFCDGPCIQGGRGSSTGAST